MLVSVDTDPMANVWMFAPNTEDSAIFAITKVAIRLTAVGILSAEIVRTISLLGVICLVVLHQNQLVLRSTLQWEISHCKSAHNCSVYSQVSRLRSCFARTLTKFLYLNVTMLILGFNVFKQSYTDHISKSVLKTVIIFSYTFSLSKHPNYETLAFFRNKFQKKKVVGMFPKFTPERNIKSIFESSVLSIYL